MPNLRAPRLSANGLGRTSAPRVPPARRKLLVVVGVLTPVLLLALAWFDGGETALRPIAQPVALPEQRP